MQIFEEQFVTRPTSDGQVSWQPISSSSSDGDDMWEIPTLITSGTLSFDTTTTDFDENASVQSNYTISPNMNGTTFSWPSRDLLASTFTMATSSVHHHNRQHSSTTTQQAPSTTGKRRKVLGDRTNNAPTRILQTNPSNSSNITQH
ncbi:unnamed protein product [Cylindrotheca closterium]|uniref:Uncharacterized protein n=1 Tax=Cylindrotheca closterium TaxID=2856 RepID=A0AAD2FL05_9STRA|nr:unnamed protein product [Cylindrotheca closterium]